MSSKLEIPEITEKITEVSVEIREQDLNSMADENFPLPCTVELFDDALVMLSKLTINQESNDSVSKDMQKDLLLEKLDLLQSGNSKKAKVKAINTTSMTKLSVHDEIEKIKHEIQTKIAEEIIPKLESIQQNCRKIQKKPTKLHLKSTNDASGVLDHALSSKSDGSSSSLESVLAVTSPDCLALSEDPLESSAVEELSAVEGSDQTESNLERDLTNAIRYTKAEMLELRCLSSLKDLERLQTLKIMNAKKFEFPPEWINETGVNHETQSNISQVDRLLLKLLSLSSVEREDYILREAETRKLLVTKQNNFNMPYYDLSENIIGEYNKCKAEAREEIMFAHMPPARPQRPIKQDHKVSSASLASHNSEIRQEPSSSPKPLNIDLNTPEKPSKRSRRPRTKKDSHGDRKELDLEIKEKKGEVANDVAYKEQFLELFRHSLCPDNMPTVFEEIIQYLVDNGKANFVEGELRVNAKNWNEGYVTKKGHTDVLVSSLILRRWALHGDIVRVLVKNDAEDGNLDSNLDDTQTSESDLEMLSKEKVHRFRGVVLNIVKEQNSRQTIGTFTSVVTNKRQQSFQPRDTKLPIILVNTTDNEIISKEMLYMVQITHWLRFQPYGKVVKMIGKQNTLDCENTAILLKYSLDPLAYSDEIIASVPQVPYEIPASEFAYRQDLRKMCIFSIDPDTARDLDDAMSCEVLPNGNWEVGVHISDVSYFLKEDDPLDLLVKEKATTIYLVNQVYHMLPVPLCLLCSLLPGADKVAYTVWWEIDPNNANVLSTRFTRSIVNSCAQLSYKHAQDVIENPNKDWTSPEDIANFPKIYNGYQIADLAKIILRLQKLAVIMRDKRNHNGALKINQPKLGFKLSKENGIPLSFHLYEIMDSHRLIEEFMLLANGSVAEFIHQKFPDISILRSHEAPTSNNLTKLRSFLSKHGLAIDTSSSRSISQSVAKIVKEADDPAAMSSVISLLVSKSMTRAKYFCSHNVDDCDFWHFALSVPIYTHFTSPIRRYSDILVHRVLNAALEYEPAPSRQTDELDALASICNVQKYNAKLAGDDSSFLYFIHCLQEESKHKKIIKMKAGVVGIYPFNLEVILQETGHLVKVYYKNLQANGDIVVQVNEDDLTSVTMLFMKEKIATEIRFGSEVNVELKVHKSKLIINNIFAH